MMVGNRMSAGIVQCFSDAVLSATMLLGLELSSPHLFSNMSKMFDDASATSRGRAGASAADVMGGGYLELRGG